METGISGIYAITNLVNGKRYIGQSKDIRHRFEHHRWDLRHGKSSNSHLQRSWNLYGENNFEMSIVEECPIDMLDEREMYWIAYYNSMDNGYNQTIGGGGCRGYHCSEEARLHISLALKGIPKSPEQIEKVRIRTIEWHKTHLNPRSIPVVCINDGCVYGNSVIAGNAYNLTKSTAAHIHDCCRGILLSAGALPSGDRLVWRYENDYKSMSDEDIGNAIYRAEFQGKRKYNGNSKAVICNTTGEMFDTIADAADAYNANKNSIGACCLGRRKHAGRHPATGERLSWSYYDKTS